MSHPTDNLRVIAFKEGDTWVAQCLEYDISASASDLDDLYGRLMLTIQMDRESSIQIHGKPFAGLERAPHHFFDLWEKRSRKMAPTVNSFDHTEVEFRLAA